VLYPSRGSAEVDLGPVHPQDCEACDGERPFRLRLTYRYERLFFVFGNVRALSYILACEVCGTPYRIPREAARRLGGLDRDPIPFLHRYGCLVLLLAVSILGLAGWLSGR
jgi:hypothetical protein